MTGRDAGGRGKAAGGEELEGNSWEELPQGFRCLGPFACSLRYRTDGWWVDPDRSGAGGTAQDLQVCFHIAPGLGSSPVGEARWGGPAGLGAMASPGVRQPLTSQPRPAPAHGLWLGGIPPPWRVSPSPCPEPSAQTEKGQALGPIRRSTGGPGDRKPSRSWQRTPSARALAGMGRRRLRSAPRAAQPPGRGRGPSWAGHCWEIQRISRGDRPAVDHNDLPPDHRRGTIGDTNNRRPGIEHRCAACHSLIHHRPERYVGQALV
jgi:hypothetical protein